MKIKYTFELYTSFPSDVVRELEGILTLAPENSYELKVIDIKHHPEKYEEKRIILSPTLIKTNPLPEQRFVGSLEQIKKTLAGIFGVSYETPPFKEKQAALIEEHFARRQEHGYAPTVRDMGIGARPGGTMLLRDVIIEAEKRRKGRS